MLNAFFNISICPSFSSTIDISCVREANWSSKSCCCSSIIDIRVLCLSILSFSAATSSHASRLSFIFTFNSLIFASSAIGANTSVGNVPSISLNRSSHSSIFLFATILIVLTLVASVFSFVKSTICIS